MASTVVVSVARDAPEAVLSLTPMLLERDEVKIRELQILPRLGKTAPSAERAIEDVLTSTNESVRFAALAAAARCAWV
jgi:hypothetical protein